MRKMIGPNQKGEAEICFINDVGRTVRIVLGSGYAPSFRIYLNGLKLDVMCQDGMSHFYRLSEESIEEIGVVGGRKK
jgi:hypothetical protein